MEAKPVRFKRNPKTRSNLSSLLWVIGLLCLFALNQTNYESILPPFLFATLIIATMLLMRLSNRSQLYYIQIYGNSMMVYRSIIWGPVNYDISNFKSVQETKSLILRRPGVIMTRHDESKLKISSWWLNENDIQRLQKILNKRFR